VLSKVRGLSRRFSVAVGPAVEGCIGNEIEERREGGIKMCVDEEVARQKGVS
jgi:hypothetical protein